MSRDPIPKPVFNERALRFGVRYRNVALVSLVPFVVQTEPHARRPQSILNSLSFDASAPKEARNASAAASTVFLGPAILMK